LDIQLMNSIVFIHSDIFCLHIIETIKQTLSSINNKIEEAKLQTTYSYI
jgi:hypothetical protein